MKPGRRIASSFRWLIIILHHADKKWREQKQKHDARPTRSHNFLFFFIFFFCFRCWSTSTSPANKRLLNMPFTSWLRASRAFNQSTTSSSSILIRIRNCSLLFFSGRNACDDDEYVQFACLATVSPSPHSVQTFPTHAASGSPFCSAYNILRLVYVVDYRSGESNLNIIGK